MSTPVGWLVRNRFPKKHHLANDALGSSL